MLYSTCIKQWYSQSRHTVVQCSYPYRRQIKRSLNGYRKERQRVYLEHTINKKIISFVRLPICRICSVLFSCSGCLKKIAPNVVYDYFEKVDHQKATRVNGRNLKVPKVKTESANRGFYFSGVKIYKAFSTNCQRI